jgi:chromosome segregation ATPase
VDFQLHSVVLELERERHASLGFKKKVADLGDLNTKLGLTVSKQQHIIETHAKDLQKVEQKWRRKCEVLSRELHLAQSALSDHAGQEKKARTQAKQMKGQLVEIEAKRAAAMRNMGAAGADVSSGAQVTSLQKALARQRDRADQLELRHRQAVAALKEEKSARAKSDKLVHELWDKVKEVESDAKAHTVKVAIERQELQQTTQKLQQELDQLRKQRTGKQKIASKGGTARQQAGRELQQVQTKMQQYRDRGEAQRLELSKVKEQLKLEIARAVSAEKALAKALQQEGKLKDAASGGMQQNSKAQLERRGAEMKAEKLGTEVRRLAEKNKELHKILAEKEKDLAALAAVQQRKKRFVGVKRTAGYVPESVDETHTAAEQNDIEEEVAEATGLAAVKAAAAAAASDVDSDDDSDDDSDED